MTVTAPDIDITPYMLADGGALDVPRCPDCWERRAHIERYEYACRTLVPGGHQVLDFGCGVGYGSKMLMAAGNHVMGYDESAEARAHCEDMTVWSIWPPGRFDVYVAFEVIEHLEHPTAFIDAVNARHLIASVPVVPTVGINRHHKHDFTCDSFRALIERRFKIRWWWCQYRTFAPTPCVMIVHAEER